VPVAEKRLAFPAVRLCNREAGWNRHGNGRSVRYCRSRPVTRRNRSRHASAFRRRRLPGYRLPG
jgi:hypothetical protein